MKSVFSPIKGLSFILLLFFLTYSPASYSQKVIELVHIKKNKVKIIYERTRVAYQLKGIDSTSLRKGRVEAIADSGIWVNDIYIPLDSLRSIGERNAFPKLLLGAGSVLAGTALIASVSSGHNMGLAQYVVGQTLLGTGLIQMVANTIKITKKQQHDLVSTWHLQIRTLPIKKFYKRKRKML